MKIKFPTKVKQAAHAVRDAVREVREASEHTAEYVLTTVKGVVKHLEALYPQSGLGETKLELAREQLESIFGAGYIETNWPKLAKRISQIVRIEKLIGIARLVK